MPMIDCFVDDETFQLLQVAAQQSGEEISGLAEEAIFAGVRQIMDHLAREGAAAIIGHPAGENA